MIYPVKDSHSYITPYYQRDHAWTDAQHDQSDEVKWSKETNTTAADHLDWVVNEQGPHSRLYPAASNSTLAQMEKAIYPVKDSHSYITPYYQRDHAWTDAQHDQSDEVKWSKETNTTAADHLDWVVNEQGPHSRLYPAAANSTGSLVQLENKWTKYSPVQSRLGRWVVNESAWTAAQEANTNEDEWRAHI